MMMMIVMAVLVTVTVTTMAVSLFSMIPLLLSFATLLFVDLRLVQLRVLVGSVGVAAHSQVVSGILAVALE